MAGSRVVRGWLTAGAVAAAVVTALSMAVADGPGASARPPTRGALVTLSVPRPGTRVGIDPVAALASVNGVREQAHASQLVGSTCLDAAAARTVALFANGSTPTRAPAGCGPVEWGWVAGTDPSGKQMLRAVATRSASGRSPLVSNTATRAGFAVGQRESSGALTGYVLVWVVAR